MKTQKQANREKCECCCHFEEHFALKKLGTRCGHYGLTFCIHCQPEKQADASGEWYKGLYALFQAHVEAGNPFYYQHRDRSIVPHSDILNFFADQERRVRRETIEEIKQKIREFTVKSDKIYTAIDILKYLSEEKA